MPGRERSPKEQRGGRALTEGRFSFTPVTSSLVLAGALALGILMLALTRGDLSGGIFKGAENASI